jgi:diguanylate cyclase (GGDEF)-like protein
LIHSFALIFPVIVIIALQYEFIGTSISCFVLALISQSMIVNGNSPFIVENTIDQLINLNVFMLCIIISSSLIGVVLKERNALIVKTYFQSITDELTGVFNRRYFFELAKIELNRLQRRQKESAIIFIDIDDFKNINDKFGHSAGDAVLREFGKLLASELRQEDIKGRLGGEEFVVLCPSEVNGKNIAEKLRTHVAEKSFNTGKQQIKITISVGVDILSGKDSNIEEALRRADTKLYKAKNSGRNIVVD